MFFSNPFKLAALFALTAATASAITCPAGQHVAINQQNNAVCRNCPKGTFNGSPVTSTTATTCTDCAPGTFGGAQGAKACCQCCAGYYSDLPAAKSCTKCRQADGGIFSAPGSTSFHDCGGFVMGQTSIVGTCELDADKCPGTTLGAPEGSGVNKKRDLACARGYKKCAHYSGMGGFDCVDVANDPESCGDCVSTEDAPGTGRDCTAIPGVSIVQCKRGGCLIESCRKGFTKSADGQACMPNKLTVQEHKRRGL